ncbi:hypothetical protein G6M89_20730 [Natronolimnobius sp. AArcel1]|uniref:hypothetical protein n=1 Tax=Natronolimnobius sp. AArcel1 TaxID=1679093 RepID=UPI0013EDD2F4|nr:hypothetical protein [Natronolimnobius sp. AArcel1]NGM71388.1 hypothetical protein [Natronolimnobius sp. AArcel1]
MTTLDPTKHRIRHLAAVLLICALVGLMVWYGTLPGYDPTANDYPNEDHVGPDPDAYVDQQASLEGTVVDTDPVVIQLEHPSQHHVTVEHATQNLHDSDALERDKTITVFGTLTSTDTLEAEQTLTREPWEATYMYIISFIGGLFALGHFIRHWRFDRRQLAFVPRDQPLSLPRHEPSDHTYDPIRGDD